MSLFKLDKSYFDTFKVLAKPKRTFSSSSSGVTGAIPVYPGASVQMKEVVTSFSDDLADELSPEALRQDIIKTAINTESVEEYLQAVNRETSNARLNKRVEVLRFEPSFRFTSDTIRKSVIKDVLYPYYRIRYGKACNWAFTNYNSLNFFAF